MGHICGTEPASGSGESGFEVSGGDFLGLRFGRRALVPIRLFSKRANVPKKASKVPEAKNADIVGSTLRRSNGF
jgi:hypothetical protein